MAPIRGRQLERSSQVSSIASLERPGSMVGPGRLELPTSRLSGVRSNQLSYGPSGGATDRRRRYLAPVGLAIAPRAPEAATGDGGKRNEDGGVPHLY